MSGGAPSGSRGEDTPHPHGARPEWVTAALLIAGVTVVARVIGFVRYLVLARTVGTTCLGDVYATANAVPNIVYELVVGGALVALVVPLVAARCAPWSRPSMGGRCSCSFP
jgi:putative peptidoglycan lipid II flippase